MPVIVTVTAVAIVLIGFNVFASRRIVQRESDNTRRLAQLALVWLVPCIGAVLALMVHRETPSGREPALDYDAPVRQAIETNVTIHD